MSGKSRTSSAQSWRTIDQSVNTRAMTRYGRRRFHISLIQTIFSIVLILGLPALGFFAWVKFESPSETVASVSKSGPVEDIVVLTDGVLSESWVADQMNLPRGILLVQVDLEAAKAALESAGQVRTAVVARDFPSTLVVTLEERVPVVRIMVPIVPERPEPMLVARDGTVYRGINYDAEMVIGLPWLDGVRLVRRGEQFEPLKGIAQISELLLAAQQEAPHLAKQWEVVSLEEFPQMIVRTQGVGEIVFGPGNYSSQLSRLDYIFDFYQRQSPASKQIARLDLSIPDQVTVAFLPRDQRVENFNQTRETPRRSRGASFFTRNP